ncbi:hypothetical protein DERP_004922 [Dermatophagoides pteronyssinus]|uniref:Uncharacterized protein n=1 Tax=Dermatophagoides pteronyssinus TaxID=6956 RepID=A0ABQ8JSW6_DERPT|nr:hypothetical protein DERP_004922 [Dermatophagoides pteronyssinus]
MLQQHIDIVLDSTYICLYKSVDKSVYDVIVYGIVHSFNESTSTILYIL